tara:strand:+ start:173 stop:415 length:243 start_codon:yes stop_codon:yes gene_type:complete
MSIHILKVFVLIFNLIFCNILLAQSLENQKFSGFRPIWFELIQKCEFGKSQLYFGDLNGNVFRLPYIMNDDFIKPKKISF